ncbi:MAG: hypothetical protein A2589_00880 [Candidatus Vogelbacteria bacterium RIFOXYD1_FULL_46_19]|uniref:Uncharacterized protein n=1 Tax=Candidatus Vogelbacteria bacterium RIFOXYD1_FULL_46_19 TaxID=1802439 RepID=A0A1G2QH46_9BACT|nr:MAG: hypothetical protein A2589_00880 [Candidatus Vogelbacteria bacterium RIFOXYD1_FULL_46_19]
MNYLQYKKSISLELATLNAQIDRKILRGQSYYREALRHKILTRQLNRLAGKTYFSRLMSNLALF